MAEADCIRIPYDETRFFSSLVTDYLAQQPTIQPFYTYAPNSQGLAQAISTRQQYPVDRVLLYATLRDQYRDCNISEATDRNLNLLKEENTFTVCTAHQPNLMTGYLYFVYKIIHAIKLADEMAKSYPGKNFVPVYYMGSEDNDLEELGTFRFRGDKYVWDGDGQKGAVGRMETKGLKKMLESLFRNFGPPGKNCDDLRKVIETAYLKNKTIGSATRYLVNELFGRYGLIVLDPDDARFKSAFEPVMKDELLNRKSFSITNSQIQLLGEKYKVQAHPREINLFYLSDQMRERIEFREGRWYVLNTDITWDEQTLLVELTEHPERFSPNVILRGLYQETILPNIAFIGGGAEVAYWMQLQTLFAHYGVFYPFILLRQSVLWVTKSQQQKLAKTGITIPILFADANSLAQRILILLHAPDWKLGEEQARLTDVFRDIEAKAMSIDPTLTAATRTANARVAKQISGLEQKMLRAEKKKQAVAIDRVLRIKDGLFPGGNLQERVENFMEYYLTNGIEFIDRIYQEVRPLDNHFLVINEQ